MKKQGRGQLTDRIKTKSKELLGEEISEEELRLMAYVQFELMNTQKLDAEKINVGEMAILVRWEKMDWLKFAEKFSCSKKFWDAMSELLWLAYVDTLK